MFCIREGEGILNVEHRSYSFKKNDIFLIAPNHLHSFKKNKEIDYEISHLSIYFDISPIKSALETFPELSNMANLIDYLNVGFKIERYTEYILLQMKKIQDLSPLKQVFQLFTPFRLSNKALT